MEWELKIPKVLYIYWGGYQLPYMRFLTIKTFIKLNPDWKVVFLYPKYVTKHTTWRSYENQQSNHTYQNFLPEVMSLPIEKVEIDFTDFGLINSLPEVHKSDFIRLYYLSKYGGLWSDMDIIYTRPMNSVYFNTKEYVETETIVCNNNYGHSVGFLLSTPNNPFFDTLLGLSKQNYDPSNYQTMGAALYNRHFPTMESINKISPSLNMNMNVVYPYTAGDENKWFSTLSLKITEYTIGYHWFGGHPQWKRFMELTNGGLNNLPNNIIGNLIRNIKEK